MSWSKSSEISGGRMNWIAEKLTGKRGTKLQSRNTLVGLGLKISDYSINHS